MKRFVACAVLSLTSIASVAQAQEMPAAYFLYNWGTGPADKLAAGFRAALDQLGTPKTTTAKR
jgi:hypothetical protein